MRAPRFEPLESSSICLDNVHIGCELRMRTADGEDRSIVSGCFFCAPEASGRYSKVPQEKQFEVFEEIEGKMCFKGFFRFPTFHRENK